MSFAFFGNHTRNNFFRVCGVGVCVQISHPNTKLSFELSQEVSLNALSSLRSRFLTLRAQNKVKCGYLLRRQEWFIEFRFSRKSHAKYIFSCLLRCSLCPLISHPNTKLSFEISQEVSLNALSSLRSRFLTLRAQNKVKCGYLLRRQEWFIEFRFSRKSHAKYIFSCLLRCSLCPLISHPNTKLSFEISQEVSLNALASLRSRFFTLRVQNKVKSSS